MTDYGKMAILLSENKNNGVHSMGNLFSHGVNAFLFEEHMSKAYLILADGTVFEGNAIGATGKTIGETVFTTGMTGYLETLTDPSYFGQIVTQTFPLIGNYGVISEDFESKKSWVRGYVVRELCDEPSNFRCGGELDAFLKAQNIIGIAGIDTRRLTKILREAGVMNGMIVSETDNLKIENGKLKIDNDILEEIRAYKIENAVASVQQNEVNASGDFKGRSPLGEGVASNEVRAQGEIRFAIEFCIRLISKVCKTRFPLLYEIGF